MSLETRGKCKMERIVFDNGLIVALTHKTDAHSAAISIYVAAGNRYEEKINSGISHFIEHMVFKGTTTRSTNDIAEESDIMGGQLNAYTAKEYTCFYSRALSEHVPRTLHLMCDMLCNPLFDEKELNTEKGVVLEEIGMYEDSPEDFCSDMLTAVCYKNEPLGFNILGTRQTVAGFTAQNLRDYMAKTYTPERIVVSLCGKFDKDTGERIVSDTEGLPPLFQDVFGETLLELAQQNEKIVGVTPAMPSGCSMNILMKTMPDRGFDVGIAEGHAVTFSGGMAKDGLLPFCNIYSSFMQRAYDNIIHDVAIEKLNVVLCLDRAGLVGQDGPTHHGAFDLAYLRPVPNLTIASPFDEHELRRLMYTAQLPDKGPFVIRYPRGRGALVNWKCPMEEIPVGKGRQMKDGKDIAVITLGPIGHAAQQAIESAEAKSGKSIAHYDLRFLKPIDEEMLHEIGQNFTQIVTVEDGVMKGGMGSAVLEFMSDNGYSPVIKRIGIPDEFIQHGTPDELYHLCRMDHKAIENILLSF
jgi:transketolase C-terminal domain/subunit